MEHWDVLPGVDPWKLFVQSLWFVALSVCLSCFTKKRLCLCQVEEDDHTNMLQGKVCLQLLGLFFVALMTNRARLRHGTTFGPDSLFDEYIHPFFRTVEADHRHACLTFLVRNWCCSHKAGDWCFPRQENVRQKKKETRERGRRNIPFRAERKSQRFLNQQAFVHFLSSAPFLSMLRRRRAPSWALPSLVFVSALAQPALGDTSTFLAVKIRLENGTFGSLFWVEFLPTTVGKDAKKIGCFPRPSSRWS